MFNSRNEIISLLNNCELKSEIDELILTFNNYKEWRDPMYIELAELDVILKFELRKQLNRQAEMRKQNSETVIRRISELALSIETGNTEYTTEIRIKILSSMKGIHTAVASAILTVVYPDRYAIIDRRNWRTLFDQDKVTFTTSDYLRYMDRIQLLSSKFHMTPQEIDMAIWQLDKERNEYTIG